MSRCGYLIKEHNITVTRQAHRKELFVTTRWEGKDRLMLETLLRGWSV
jgi:hypothetical protein